MQKAMKWLTANNFKFEFHNYKESGISPDVLATWLKHIPADKLINTKSATYRALAESDRQKALSSNAEAIKIMMDNNSIIKRPLIDLGNNKYLLGWDDKIMEQLRETL